MFSDWLRRNRLLLLLLLLTSLVFAVAAHRLVGLAADDAFIHRRIALNYVQTGHAYFNPGQRVMVTSSPLWTILLALGTIILHGSDPAPWLEMFFILASSAAAFLLLREGAQPERESAVLFPAFAFLYTFIGNFASAIDQMETPCAIAFLLAGTLGIARRKSWGVPLLVVACFVRFECCLLLLLAVVWTSVRQQWTKSSLIASAVSGLSAVAWLLSQYHTVIPNSALAKNHAYTIPYKLVAHSFSCQMRRRVSAWRWLSSGGSMAGIVAAACFHPPVSSPVSESSLAWHISATESLSSTGICRWF